MTLKTLRLGSVFTAVLISLAFIFAGSRADRSAASLPIALPAPHLGYGINVRHNLNLVPTGFDWIKIYEDELAGLPAGALGYHVLLRVNALGYPASISSYVQHITDLVTANAARLTAIEIGNEPNMSWSWGGQAVSPENYAQLLCQTRSALKAIAPNLIVVSAGLGPVGRVPAGNPDVMDDRVFAQRMLTTMQTEFPAQYPCFDAFGFHPQGYPYAPDFPAPWMPCSSQPRRNASSPRMPGRKDDRCVCAWGCTLANPCSHPLVMLAWMSIVPRVLGMLHMEARSCYRKPHANWWCRTSQGAWRSGISASTG